MPETAAVGDMYQVRVKGFNQQQEVNNVFHFSVVAPVDDVDLRLIQVLIQCYVMHLLPQTNSNMVYDTVVWKRVAPTLGPEFVSSFPPSSNGAVVGDPLPSYVAAVNSIRTAQGGKSHRGRFFLSGFGESNSLGQTMTGPTRDAIIAFIACVVTGFITGSGPGTLFFKLGVYSRKLGGSHFPYSNVGFTPAVSITQVTNWATMRSRKLGKGT